MTAVIRCQHPGCRRTARRNPGAYVPAVDLFCSAHDGKLDHGDVCHCALARPEPISSCIVCERPVVHLWPPERYRAAVAVWPELEHQRVDWTLRSPGERRPRPRFDVPELLPYRQAVA